MTIKTKTYKYYVNFREVHINCVEVTSPQRLTREDAIELAKQAIEDGDDQWGLEYSHTLDDWHTTVEEAKE